MLKDRQTTHNTQITGVFFAFASNKLLYLHREQLSLLLHSVSAGVQSEDLLGVSDFTMTSQLVEERLGDQTGHQKTGMNNDIVCNVFSAI